MHYEFFFKDVFYEIIKSIDLINVPSMVIVALYVFEDTSQHFLPEIKTESGFILNTESTNKIP